RVDNGVGNLAGLLGDQHSPRRVALGPHVFPFVVETLAPRVDRDAERNRIETRDDPSVELRRTAINGDGVAGAWIANRRDAGIEQKSQHAAAIVWRAADHEVVRRRAP